MYMPSGSSVGTELDSVVDSAVGMAEGITEFDVLLGSSLRGTTEGVLSQAVPIITTINAEVIIKIRLFFILLFTWPSFHNLHIYSFFSEAHRIEGF
jgi:hypothetical protein